MSITSRINEMSSHIEQAYNGLQGLGADLTNVNKNIENISMVLDDIYDSMPQVSGEGISLTLDDTRVGKIKSTLKGNTSQDGTPTPTTPIPVNVVSGDNEIVVCGENLLPDEWTSGSISGSTGQVVNYGSRIYTTNKIILDGNTTYCFKHNNTSTWSIRASIDEYDKDNNHLGRIGGLNGSVNGEFTTQSNTKYINITIIEATDTITYAEYQTLLSNGKLQPMLNVGSSASTYEPYQGNTYNIDLPEGMELCKIGNYQDYFYKDSGKWYLHKEIGKVVLNGSENTTQNYNQSMFRVPLDNFIHRIGSPSNLGKSNYYTCRNYSDMYNGIVETGFEMGDQGNNYIYIRNASITSVADFKTWLSTHNVEVYYPLATPTGEEITYQPLIEQLNLLEKAISYEEQTNITQVNNDLPFIISASALKEWQENTSLNSTLSMVNPLSLGNTLNTQENDIQPIEVDNIEPLEEEENEES